MKIKLEEFSQIFKIVILFFSLPNIYSQETPLGSKIVGNGDALNYYIGHFPVNGSDGLDLHWHGGIRFGDATSTSVMQITNGNVGIGTISPSAKFHVLGANGSLLIDNLGSGENYYNATNFQEFQIGGISKMRLNLAGNLGIGTNSPLAKLHVNNGDNSYGAILANATESSFSLYTKTLSTNPSSESFRLGLKYLDNENNGYISFYRGGNAAGGFLGFSTNGQERIRISNAGLVGIGTSLPIEKLDLNGNILLRNFTNNADAGAYIHFSSYADNNLGPKIRSSLVLAEGANSKSSLILSSYYEGYKNELTLYNGKVGIGTSSPLAKLEVRNGDILVKNLLNANDSSSIMIGQSIVDGNHFNFGTSIRTITQNSDNNSYGMQFFTQESYTTNQTEKVRIQGNGYVGIGTTAPDEKLTVKGKIHTQEVRVDLAGPLAVPDYVFANDYKLKSLDEVEAYIKKNSHLPEIPSAKEIEKNGLMLAEMNMNLLKKIEELTLYSIDQNKKIETQAKEIEALKDLVLRVTKLENEMVRK